MCIDWETVSSVATAVSMVVVAYQSYLMKKSFKYNCEWQEKEKAAELAGLYKDKILPNVFYIFNIMRITGIDQILGNITQESISQFTNDEFIRISGKDTIPKILELQKNTKNIPLLLAVREKFPPPTSSSCSNSISLSLASFYAEKRSEDELKKILSSLWDEFSSIQDEILNDLEFFAMHFTSSVADETIVFQSLHQTYLTAVQHLYYQIAVRNTSAKDKYYTNVIELYRLWSARDLENEIKANEAVYHPSPVRK